MRQRTCAAEGCNKAGKLTRGLCPTHYSQWWRGPGRFEAKRLIGHPEERFWQKVNKNGPVPDFAPHLGPCWIWTGTISHGYGMFWTGEAYAPAHRWGFERYVGPIPQGLMPDHLCRVPLCVNYTGHLEPVSARENQRRGLRGVLTTACPQGHPYDAANTRLRIRSGTTDTRRDCRTCERERMRLHRERKKAR